MRFFRSTSKKKRLRINRLASIISISTLALAGCVGTPDQTAGPSSPSAIHGSGHAQPGQAQRGDIADLLATDEAIDEPVPYALDGSAWARLRAGFKLDQDLRHPLIDAQLKFYRDHPSYVYRASERAGRYFHYVLSAVEQRDLPTELALLPIVESAYDPFAYSRSGASGMWQFIARTGRHFGLKSTWWYDGRRDVVASTDAALTYLQYLHDRFDGDWLLAVAAYNFGEGNLSRAIERNRRRGLPTDFWHLELREETRLYVPKLLALSRIMAAPASYGISLHPIPNQAYFAAVDTRGPLDLSRAASLAGVDVKELHLLNPGINHGATDPNGPHRLLLPAAAAERFNRRLAQLPAAERMPSRRHVVARGETLSGIARRFGSDVASIRALNELSGHLIKPGQNLLIPAAGPAIAGTAAASRRVIHTVRPGESPWRIAQRYGITADQILRWNGLEQSDYLKAGQRLSLWLPGSPAADGKAGARRVGYTVRSGDSLGRIASRFNVHVNDIARWNQVSPTSLLHPGQKLTLYVDAGTGGLN